jgi:stringent starvation protein B
LREVSESDNIAARDNRGLDMDIHARTTDEMRVRIAEYLHYGRVIVVATADDPDHAGLPALNGSQVLRLDLCPEDTGVKLDDTDHLHVKLMNGDQTTDAQISWSSIFFVAGQSAEDQKANRMATHLRQELPDFLKQDTPKMLQALVASMGLGPPPVLEWKLDVSPSIIASDADRSTWCPDKREAVQRILGRGQAPALIWFDPEAGVTLPSVFATPGRCEIHVGTAAGSQDIDFSQTELSWNIQTPNGLQRVVVPWEAVGAVRDAGNGQGWWWPRDLPPQPRSQFETNAELWQVLERLEGMPLSVPVKISIAMLQPVTLKDKVAAFRRLQRQGFFVLLVDAGSPGLRLPPSLPGRARVLMLPVGLANLDPKVRLDAEGVSLQAPDYAGLVAAVYIPWSAVFLMSPAGGGAPHTWPEDYPQFLVDAVFAMRAVNRSDGGELPPELDVFDHRPNGDGLGLGLTTGPDGGTSLIVSRPLGEVPLPPGSPPGMKQRAMMQLVFRLPVPLLQ